MADLDPLIRYRKHGVDEKRKVLAQLYQDAEMLEKRKHEIERQMEEEARLAEDMATPEALTALGRFLEASKKRVFDLAQAIQKTEQKIARAQDEVREAFADMKKIEITHRNRKDSEKAALQKKEDQELDEVALDGYRRQQDES